MNTWALLVAWLTLSCLSGVLCIASGDLRSDSDLIISSNASSAVMLSYTQNKTPEFALIQFQAVNVVVMRLSNYITSSQWKAPRLLFAILVHQYTSLHWHACSGSFAITPTVQTDLVMVWDKGYNRPDSTIHVRIISVLVSSAIYETIKSLTIFSVICDNLLHFAAVWS